MESHKRIGSETVVHVVPTVTEWLIRKMQFKNMQAQQEKKTHVVVLLLSQCRDSDIPMSQCSLILSG